MDFYKDDVFGAIISERLKQIGIQSTDLVRILNERGFTCKIRQMQRYMRGQYVPKYETAKEICEILEVDINGEDLEELLNASREHAKEIQNLKPPVKSRTCSINMKDIHLGAELDPADIGSIIDSRIMELYGTAQPLNQYVAALIENDLKNNTLKKEGTEND